MDERYRHEKPGSRDRVFVHPYEEAVEDSGDPRPHYAELLGRLHQQDLADLSRRVARTLALDGVTFGSGAGEEAFTIDPVPRVIGAQEWRELEAGLIQRVRAINEFVRDAYGEQRIVEAGIVPAGMIESCRLYEPSLAGTGAEGQTPVAIAGLDVVRDSDGKFKVLEDNVRTPSGLAYALAARQALDEHLPPPEHRLDLDGAMDMLCAVLRGAARNQDHEPVIVLLTDGGHSSAWYEHRTLAERLNVRLARVQDLVARDDGLYVRGARGLGPVDVVYRRTDEDQLTDDHGKPTDVGAVLFEPYRRCQVACVNAFGTGVADDKLAHAYVEQMVRFYLGEEPLIGSVPTYDLSDADVREDVLGRIDEVVIKPRSGSGGHGILVGAHARPEDRDAMRDAVRANPAEFIAQETVWLSRHPTVVENRLEPRHVDLRAFVYLAGDRGGVVPGGLTRVARKEGALVVNSSQQGGGKDTWVLR